MIRPILLAVAIVTAAGNPWTAPPREREIPNPTPAGAESLDRGRALYEKHCLACHGEKGDGKGPVAKRLGFTAADLTAPGAMIRQTDGEIFWKIATGRDPMPSFRKDKGLADAQIWDIVNHVRTLAPPPSRDEGTPPPR